MIFVPLLLLIFQFLVCVISFLTYDIVGWLFCSNYYFQKRVAVWLFCLDQAHIVFISLDNFGILKSIYLLIQVNNISGYLPGRIVFFLV